MIPAAASEASPLWHMALVLFGAVFLLFEAWRGWRAGFARSAVNLFAFGLSGAIGFFVGSFAASLFGGFGVPAGFFAGLVTGGLVGLVLFFGIWLAGALFLKRTGQQGSGILRFFWGAGGALLGLALGLLVLWGGISMVRAVGALAEGTTETARARQEKPRPVERSLVTLKESLEMGPAGDFFQNIDLIPPDTYELIVQISRVSSDPDAMVRFIEYPGIQALIENPVIVDLMSDPVVIEAAEKRNYPALLANPALHKAVADPDLARQIQAIDLKEALRHATQGDGANPATSPPGQP